MPYGCTSAATAATYGSGSAAGGISIPLIPCATWPATPPVSDIRIGVPCALASQHTTGEQSARVGKTKKYG